MIALSNINNAYVSRCRVCGLCQEDCPTYKVTRNEALSARGKIAIFNEFLNGNIPLSYNFNKIFSECTSCLQCSIVCPSGIDPVNIINAARQVYFSKRGDNKTWLFAKWIMKKNRLYRPLLGLLNLFRILYSIGSKNNSSIPYIYNIGFLKDAPYLVRTKRQKLAAGFFVGCMIDLVYKDIGWAVIDMCKQHNIDLIIPKDQICCGAPAYYKGDIDTATMLAKKNYAIFSSLKADMIINACATCGSTVRNIYPMLLDNMCKKDIIDKFLDIHSVLLPTYTAETRRDASMSNNKKINITCHIPCHLSRGQGIIDDVINILKASPRFNYIEMDGKEECCGGAGDFYWRHKILATKIGERKIKNILATGAEVVVTACPSCKMYLTNLLSNSRVNIKVLHTVELLY